MTCVILTSLSGVCLMLADRAEVVVRLIHRFVCGPLPSQDELATYVAARTDAHAWGSHWSDYVGRFPGSSDSRKDLGVVEFCQHYNRVELWFDPCANDPLLLIWLLDHLRFHPAIRKD